MFDFELTYNPEDHQRSDRKSFAAYCRQKLKTRYSKCDVDRRPKLTRAQLHANIRDSRNKIKTEVGT